MQLGMEAMDSNIIVSSWKLSSIALFLTLLRLFALCLTFKYKQLLLLVLQSLLQALTICKLQLTMMQFSRSTDRGLGTNCKLQQLVSLEQ